MLTSIVAIAPDDATQTYQPIKVSQSIPAGQTSRLQIAVKRLDGVTARSIAGFQIRFKATDVDGNTLISTLAVVTDADHGLAYVDLVDSYTSGKVGTYTYDAWLEEIATGKRYQIVGVSAFTVLSSRGVAGEAVTLAPPSVPVYTVEEYSDNALPDVVNGKLISTTSGKLYRGTGGAWQLVGGGGGSGGGGTVGVARWGNAVIPGAYDAAFVSALANTRAQTSFSGLFAFPSNGGGSGYGTPASQFGATTPDTDPGVSGAEYEVGVRFSSALGGEITKVRFNKSSVDPNSTHRIRLWAIDGTLLQEWNTTSETASGWQELAITPYVLTAATDYVISVLIPVGGDGPFFSTYSYPQAVGDLTFKEWRAATPSAFPTSNALAVYQGPDFDFAPVAAIQQYAHITLLASWGDPALFAAGGVGSAWAKVASSVNVGGVAYDVWRAPFVYTAPLTFEVS